MRDASEAVDQLVRELLTALIFLALSAGEFGPFAPFTWLRRLPFFSSFRIPSRLTIDVLLFGVLAAAVAIRARLERMGWSPPARAAVVLMCTVGTVQLTWRTKKEGRIP